MINLPPKTPKGDTVENVIDRYVKEHQQTGITEAKMERMNL